MDAGFSLAFLLAQDRLGFVVRMAQNTTARKNVLPDYSGKGRPAEYGESVRPLPRKHKTRTIPATEPDQVVTWKDGRRPQIRAHLYENVVAANEKPGGTPYRLVVIFDPRYHKPLVLATNLTVTAEAVWRLYKDRWPVEQLPLAAKQITQRVPGAERSFVFSNEARYRLPELALLAGNFLSYVAATVPAVATGFWDRCCRPTCGRLRRYLERLHFSELPLPEDQLRKKASIFRVIPRKARISAGLVRFATEFNCSLRAFSEHQREPVWRDVRAIRAEPALPARLGASQIGRVFKRYGFQPAPADDAISCSYTPARRVLCLMGFDASLSTRQPCRDSLSLGIATRCGYPRRSIGPLSREGTPHRPSTTIGRSPNAGLIAGAIWAGLVAYLLTRALRQFRNYQHATISAAEGTRVSSPVSVIVPARNESTISICVSLDCRRRRVSIGAALSLSMTIP